MKIKSILNKWFPRTLVVQGGSKCDVIAVNKDAETLTEAIGMSDERAEQLVGICHQSFHSHNDIVSVVEEVSKECVHANELFFVSTVIKSMQAKAQDQFGSILQKMFRA